MAFGIYVHIPYCIQRCSYCDFATYVRGTILPPEQYIELVKEEIRQKAHLFHGRKLDTIYFGGGTPSLIEPHLIVAVIEELEKHGLRRHESSCEITIEINPATLDESKISYLIDHGVNRFSVGAQTFNNKLLKDVQREHNAEQTKQTLRLLQSRNLNYSFDILFALPGQTLEMLQDDLRQALEFSPAHISPYCLTVPSGHPLSKGRPPEEEQVEMFNAIEEGLTQAGFTRYEISNFAKPGFESKHNMLYWTDSSYWGLGLSSHSYELNEGEFGSRFWNPNNINAYAERIEKFKGVKLDSVTRNLATSEYENLNSHQSMSDYCHTSLRIMRGLSIEGLRKKFPTPLFDEALRRLNKLTEHGLLHFRNDHWTLSQQGILISNQVFEEMTFLAD